jgi:hypothetical protein
VTELNPKWVEAAARAMGEHDGAMQSLYIGLAEAVLAAVVPLIEAATKAKCAGEVTTCVTDAIVSGSFVGVRANIYDKVMDTFEGIVALADSWVM